MIGTPEKIVHWLWQQDKEKLFEIKEKKNRRSLSQNAYAWKLIGNIADVMRLSKEEVYFKMLKDYGQAEVVSLLAPISLDGFVKYYEKIGTGTVNGKEFVHYKIFKGSSEFDSREMTIFIDGIIQECKQLGIETLTPEEIASMRLI